MQQTPDLQRVGFLSGWWPERLASAAAVAGLLFTVLSGFQVRSWQGSGSDLKTLYASAWCFSRGVDAYQIANIARVFQLNHVVPPGSWYAHAPVYPPFTLGLIAPLTALPMVPAIYLWVLLSGVMLAAALARLAQAAGEGFGLSRGWRLFLIALAAASPLVSFGLEMGNVSVMAAALCLLAVMAPAGANRWGPAAVLAGAVLLKPHLSIWVVLALLLFRFRGRRIAVRASVLCAVALLGTTFAGVLQHPPVAQAESYRTLVGSELASGSMAAGNREVMDAAAQITSLWSLLGFWSPHAISLQLLGSAVLALMGAALLWASWRLRWAGQDIRFDLIAAWSAFGMIATYHRAHDGMLLLLLLPSLLARLRRNAGDGLAWTVLCLFLLVSTGPSPETLVAFSSKTGLYAVAQFMLYRQAAMASFLLALLLVSAMVRTARRELASESLEWRNPQFERPAVQGAMAGRSTAETTFQ